jgi:hypothetical protein
MKEAARQEPMNIQFVRLDDDICGVLNRMALDQRRTVSDLVNEILRQQLQTKLASAPPAEDAASA